MRLLIVDDDADDLFLLREALRRSRRGESVEVETAASGSDALSRLDAMARAGTLPCAVLSDMQMPGGGGVYLLERMRADSRLADIPLLLLTSSDAGEEVEAARALGARVVRKPVMAAEFDEVLRELRRAGVLPAVP